MQIHPNKTKQKVEQTKTKQNNPWTLFCLGQLSYSWEGVLPQSVVAKLMILLPGNVGIVTQMHFFM